MATKVTLPTPTWAFNYNSSYSFATDVPNVSINYPSYTYYNANYYVNKANNPAFVDHALTGCVGQGISLYAPLNSYVVGGDPHLWVDMTHAWSMAIPDNINCPVGIFMINSLAGTGYPPNYDMLGPAASINAGLWIDKDNYLKIMYYNSSYYPPTEIENTGVDMTPYMYPAGTAPTAPYQGHRYAVVYNAGYKKYDLYIDNTNSIVASITHNALAKGALMYMNSPTYWEWFNGYGGIVNNWINSGPGIYYSNTYAPGYNVYEQYNVYFSDWYAYKETLNLAAVNALLTWNFRFAKPVKNNSYYGALGNCHKLNSIIVPGVTVIPSSFISGNNLSNITLSEGTEIVSSYSINSAMDMTITLPKSADTISSAAVQAKSVNVNIMSQNVLMRENMFFNNNENSAIPTDAPYNRYERYEGMIITGFPPKQLNSPSRVHLTPTTNRFYNAIQNSLPNITVDNNLLSFNWYNANVQLRFNDTVNKAAHSNAIGMHVSGVTDNAYTLTMHSLEHPESKVSQLITIINDVNFETGRYTGYGTVSITDHETGMFTDMYTVLDGTLIVNNIDFYSPVHASYPAEYNIHLAHNTTNKANCGKTEYVQRIQNLPGGANNVHVLDGHICMLNTAINSSTVVNIPSTSTFENVNFIHIQHNYLDTREVYSEPKNLTFINCFNVSGHVAPSATPTTVADNYITCAGNFNGYTLSGTPLIFRHWRSYMAKNYIALDLDMNAPVEDEPYIDIIKNTDITTFAYNSTYEVPDADNAAWAYRYIEESNSPLKLEKPFVVSNSALPSEIVVANMQPYTGQFIDCIGLANLIVTGIACTDLTVTRYSQLPGTPIIANHDSAINITVDVLPVPFRRNMPMHESTMRTGSTALQHIALASNCNIALANINYQAINGTNRSNLVRVAGSSTMHLEGALDGTTNLPVRDLTALYVHGSHGVVSLSSFNVHSMHSDEALHTLILDNCAMNCSISSILETCSSINIHSTTLLDPINVTLDRVNNTMYPKCLAISNVAGQITIKDKTGLLNSLHISLGSVNASVNYTALAAPKNAFRFSNFSTINIDAMIVEQWAFSNCNGPSSVYMPNCLFIGDYAFAFSNDISSITVNPKCSIAPNAFRRLNAANGRTYNAIAAGEVAVQYASNVPVALNVDYNVVINGETVDSRTVDAPVNFGSLRNRIKVNAVYADSTEVPLTDFYLVPDFASSRRDTTHTLFAAGCITQICKPYNSIENSYNDVTSKAVDLHTTYSYGQAHQILNSWHGGVYIDSNPSMGGRNYNTQITSINGQTGIMVQMINGNYESYIQSLSEYPPFAIGLNSTLNGAKANTHAFISDIGYPCEYWRDDSFNSSVPSSFYCSNANTAIIDLQHAAYTSQLYTGQVKNCHDTLAVVLPGRGQLEANSICDCSSLFHISFKDPMATCRITANAIVNCPSLQYLELPRGTTYIFAGALNRTGLKNIKIPSTCTVQTNALPTDCVITYY